MRKVVNSEQKLVVGGSYAVAPTMNIVLPWPFGPLNPPPPPPHDPNKPVVVPPVM